ncbi:hypothetical protein [Algivirga pacifica]|uniref:Uncharacterized protein n=1 Tax=Algivirga pacifica TaxID=1162670 RepID=A0ABP9DT07_9BACT
MKELFEKVGIVATGMSLQTTVLKLIMDIDLNTVYVVSTSLLSLAWMLLRLRKEILDIYQNGTKDTIAEVPADLQGTETGKEEASEERRK